MRRRFKVSILAGMLLCVGTPSLSFGQALPVDAIGRAVTGIMQDNFFFKAADFAKQQSTITKMSESAMKAAANAPKVGTGASWLSGLKYLGRATLPGVAIGLAVDAAISWIFGDDSASLPPPDPDNPTEPEVLGVDEIKIPAPPNTSEPPGRTYVNDQGETVRPPSDTPFELEGRLRRGQFAFRGLTIINGQTIRFHGMDPVSLSAVIAAQQTIWDIHESIVCSWWQLGGYKCTARATYIPTGVTQTKAEISVISHLESGEVDCPAGHYYRGADSYSGECLPDASPVPGGVDSVKTIDQATADLPETELQKQINPQILSEIANQLWLDAASQPDYQGVPHPGWQGISQFDVQNWLNANPELWPTVQSAAQPAPPTQAETWTLPPLQDVNAPNPEPNPNPNPSVDLGPDPGIPEPGLEAIPTAEMIINPLRSFFPDLKNYSVPLAAGECPRPTFEVFESSYIIESHCDLFEQNRTLIQLAMMAAFAIASLLIVLRA